MGQSDALAAALARRGKGRRRSRSQTSMLLAQRDDVVGVTARGVIRQRRRFAGRVLCDQGALRPDGAYGDIAIALIRADRWLVLQFAQLRARRPASEPVVRTNARLLVSLSSPPKRASRCCKRVQGAVVRAQALDGMQPFEESSLSAAASPRAGGQQSSQRQAAGSDVASVLTPAGSESRSAVAASGTSSPERNTS
jgi:hypothetical protein